MSEKFKAVNDQGTGTLWSRITSYINSRVKVFGSVATEDVVPVNKGGHGATTAKEARSNLGITYGVSAPTTAPSTGDGTVYFFEDNLEPMAIEEGGTGAADVAGALDNLGLGELGKVYNGAWASVSAAKAAYTKVASLTVPAGTYIISSHLDFGSAIDTNYNHLMEGGGYSICIRNNMMSGGGSEVTRFWSFSEETTITLQAYNTHTADVTARGSIDAIRIR